MIWLLDWLHVASLAALAWLAWLAPDSPTWRWWVGCLLVTACGTALARDAAAGQFPRLLTSRSLLPYAAYAVAWLLAYWSHPSNAGRHELASQIVFLAAILCVARATCPPRILAIVVAILCIIGLQVLGPVSVVVGTGRATHYKSLDQWGGYPEIGMQVALGAAACLAIVLATRRRALAAAAAVLAAGFAASTVYMLSRSAMLTIVVVGIWLAIVAAIAFRSRLAMATLAVGAAGTVVVGVVAGSALWARATSAMLIQGSEVDVRSEGWRAATAMLRDHPFVGVGPGRYPEEYARYSTFADPAHAYNMPLHIGAEIGLIGLIAYAVLWGRLLIKTLRAAGASAGGMTALALHGMLVTFLLRSQSEHFLGNLPTSFRMLLVLGLVMGLAEAASRRPVPAPSATIAGAVREHLEPSAGSR